MKVAIYARVSDDKKKTDGERRQDVNRQLELLRNHLQRQGIQDWTEYIDDGKSGWSDDLNTRPSFNKLRNDVFRHHITKIYIESMDRFSSNLISGMGWLEEFARCNVNVTSLAEGEYQVTSDDGWAKSAMFLFMAEWRIRNLRSKIRSGMSRRLNNPNAKCGSCGIVHMGRHPLSCQCTKCKKGGSNQRSKLAVKEQTTES